VILGKGLKEAGIGRARGEFKTLEGTFMFTLDVGKRCY